MFITTTDRKRKARRDHGSDIREKRMLQKAPWSDSVSRSLAPSVYHRDEPLMRIAIMLDDMLPCSMGNVYLAASKDRGWSVDEQIEKRDTR